MAEVSQGLVSGVGRLVGADMTKYKNDMGYINDKIFGEAKKLAPKWFEGGKEVGKTAAVMALTPSA